MICICYKVNQVLLLYQVGTDIPPPLSFPGDRRGGDRMVIGFITSYAISAYHH